MLRRPSGRLRSLPVNSLIPNILTVLALCAGMTSIRLALEQRWDLAVLAIVAASILDGLDGRMARLLKGATYGETVGVTCWLERLKSRGMRYAYEVDRDGEVLARGRTDHVWVERASGKPCRIPEILREPFARLARSSESGGQVV